MRGRTGGWLPCFAGRAQDIDSAIGKLRRGVSKVTEREHPHRTGRGLSGTAVMIQPRSPGCEFLLDFIAFKPLLREVPRERLIGTSKRAQCVPMTGLSSWLRSGQHGFFNSVDRAIWFHVYLEKTRKGMEGLTGFNRPGHCRREGRHLGDEARCSGPQPRKLCGFQD